MDKILWVCETYDLADQRRHAFGFPDHVMFVYPGVALVGHVFDEIIFDGLVVPSAFTTSQKQRAQRRQWLEHLTTKLYPKGTIKNLVVAS